MRKIVLPATTVVIVLAMAATASAKSLSASALVQSGNGNCGHYEPGGPIAGSAKFKRTGNVVKVTYSVKTLTPSTKFEMRLYSGASCSLLETGGAFTTNSKGAGKITTEMLVPEGEVEFFLDATSGPFTNNDSFIVTLPKP